MALKYFKSSEFSRCVPSCSLDEMNSSFLARLDLARSYAGVPFVLNSAFRSKEWELEHGRDGLSSHCKGCAVDIRCTDSVSRLKIVKACSGLFPRIGISDTFIHVDMDFDKPACLWLY